MQKGTDQADQCNRKAAACGSRGETLTTLLSSSSLTVVHTTGGEPCAEGSPTAFGSTKNSWAMPVASGTVMSIMRVARGACQLKPAEL